MAKTLVPEYTPAFTQAKQQMRVPKVQLPPKHFCKIVNMHGNWQTKMNLQGNWKRDSTPGGKR
jgi:hypothetical protein